MPLLNQPPLQHEDITDLLLHTVPLKAEFHYASWFEAGSELKFGISSSLLAAN